jgi:hypothetical protein
MYDIMERNAPFYEKETLRIDRHQFTVLSAEGRTK